MANGLAGGAAAVVVINKNGMGGTGSANCSSAASAPVAASFASARSSSASRTPSPRFRYATTARPNRHVPQLGSGLYVCGNCRLFEQPTPKRLAGCRGLSIAPEQAPCAIDRHGFGQFDPLVLPPEVEAIDVSRFDWPALRLLRFVAARAEVLRRHGVHPLRMGQRVFFRLNGSVVYGTVVTQTVRFVFVAAEDGIVYRLRGHEVELS